MHLIINWFLKKNLTKYFSNTTTARTLYLTQNSKSFYFLWNSRLHVMLYFVEIEMFYLNCVLPITNGVPIHHINSTLQATVLRTWSNTKYRLTSLISHDDEYFWRLAHNYHFFSFKVATIRCMIRCVIRCMIRCVVRYDYYRLHDFSSFISISRWFLIMHVPVLILVINNSLAHNLLHDVSEQYRNRIGTTLGHKHCQTNVDCFNEGPHD